MIRLRTLGGLSVERSDSESPPTLQRRPLALLAVLDGAGELGISRDKLLAYFWPESDEDRARNVLRQLLHTIRRDLDSPDLFLGTSELRLNSALLTSDSSEFERACDAGRFEAAFALYRGPFLDGFYLSSAAGFESWKESERARVARRFVDAAERVARAAAVVGDHSREVGVWERLAAAEPLNSRIAIELMRAMAAAGDLGGAIKFSRVHDALLREELGTAPPAEYAHVVADLRSLSHKSPQPPLVVVTGGQSSSDSVGPPTPAPRLQSGAERRTESTVATAPVLVRPVDVKPVLRRARQMAFVAVGAVAVATGAIAWRWHLTGRNDGADASEIAVLPFDDNSPDGRYGWLANGLAFDLIDALSTVPALSVRSPEAVRPFRNKASPLDSVTSVLRVGTLVSGSIDEIGDSLRIGVRIASALTGASVGPTIRVMARRAEIGLARQRLVDSVASALRTTLGEHAVMIRRWREAGNSEAWELLQRGDETRLESLDRMRRGDVRGAAESLGLADSLLARAERVATSWPEPLVLRGWIAEARALLAAEQPSDRCSAACIALRRDGIAYADRALDLNRDDIGALELRGTLHSLLHLALRDSTQARAELDLAERDLRRALVGDSTRARSWLSLARVYRGRGDFLGADAAAQRAVRADPWLSESRDALQTQMINALERSDGRGARQLCEAGRRAYPETRVFVECRLYLHGWLGTSAAEADSAARELARIEALTYPPGPDFTRGYRRAMVGAVLARAGMRDSARAVLRATERLLPAGDPNWPVQRAYVQVALGDTAEALQSLEYYAHVRPQRRQVLASLAWFSGLRDNPRFQAIVRAPEDSSPTAAERRAARR